MYLMGRRKGSIFHTDTSVIHFKGLTEELGWGRKIKSHKQLPVVSKTQSSACPKELRLCVQYKYLLFFFQKDKKNFLCMHEFPTAKQTCRYGQGLSS